MLVRGRNETRRLYIRALRLFDLKVCLRNVEFGFGVSYANVDDQINL